MALAIPSTRKDPLSMLNAAALGFFSLIYTEQEGAIFNREG